MLISVLIPVYNAMPYLEACIDSILNQSHQRFELILVDDFSTDGSLEVLNHYALQDSRVKVFSNSEKGIIPALALAFVKSTGGYITRMDADDIMTPKKLELMMSALTEDPTAVVVGKVKYFAEGKELAAGYVKYAKWLNSMIDHKSHYDHIYKECVIPSPCWMMSRQMLESIGGFSSQLYPEDYDLTFRMYEHGIKVVGLSQVLHYWRDHDRRASRNDSHYSDQGFLQLKLHYFLKIDRKQNKPLILWGAGRTGKAVAKALLSENIAFRWMTDNTQKAGHIIYGVELELAQKLLDCRDSQVITAIKTPTFMSINDGLFLILRQAECDIFHFF